MAEITFLNDLATFAERVGAPLTSMFILLWLHVKQRDLHIEERKEMRKEFTDLNDQTRQVINELTTLLRELLLRL
jgi:hypothetical protein